MMNQSQSSAKSLVNETGQHSQSFIPLSQKYTHYSRHLRFKDKRTPSIERFRLVIHVTTRSPQRNRPSKRSRSIDHGHDLHSMSTILKARYRRNKTNDVDETKRIRQSSTFNKMRPRHRSLPTSIQSSSIDNEMFGPFKDKYNYLPKSSNKVNSNNIGRFFGSQHLSSDLSINVTPHDSNQLYNRNPKIEIKKRRKRKRRYLAGFPCPCLCFLASLVAALLLGAALAAALLAILKKPQTTAITPMATITSSSLSTITTTATTTTVAPITTTATTVSTTVSTTIAVTTTSTAVAFSPMITTTTSAGITTVTTTTVTFTPTSSSTSTISTTSTSVITSTSCTTPSSTNGYYSAVTVSYTAATLTYIASSTGTTVLEFGFSSIGSGKYGYLDDVSIVDTNASNAEMLINGGFENGTLVGWQVLCTSSCMTTSGAIASTSCNTGSFCYKDGCKGGLDFLRQTFNTIIGHIYTLTFWLRISTGNDDAFVRIF